MAKKTTHCATCGELKIRRSTYSRCIPCARRWSREYYRRSEDYRSRIREHYLRRRYGVDFEAVVAMLAAQHDCCAICGRRWQECPPAKKTPYESMFLHHLCVDHDHVSGRVRGLLCNACNTAIGLFEEMPERFAAAVDYLQQL